MDEYQKLTGLPRALYRWKRSLNKKKIRYGKAIKRLFKGDQDNSLELISHVPFFISQPKSIESLSSSELKVYENLLLKIKDEE